tara:strand:+ start:530 stop:1093 length:564 start_codon:yes stop_codon:yes gene_type:complete
MRILVGLGNPGRKYSDTKHNFGFWIIDEFAKKSSLTFRAGKGDYIVGKKDNVVCVKPTTFMNNSGIALLDVKQFFKAEIENILVIYDDIDLPLGNLRFRENGSSGGHRGIASIITHLNTENFNRLRLGIATNESMRPSEKYVLSKFEKNYERIKNEMIQHACDGIEYFLLHGMKTTMNKYNKKIGIK